MKRRRKVEVIHWINPATELCACGSDSGQMSEAAIETNCLECRKIAIPYVTEQLNKLTDFLERVEAHRAKYDEAERKYKEAAIDYLKAADVEGVQ